MTTYNKNTERPLSEIIGNRKTYYHAKIDKAFDVVYKSGNFACIEQFEQAILALSERAIEGNLEGILVGSARKTLARRMPKTEEVDRRPRLTSYQYAKCRDEGMTNEQIKEKFRMDSPYQLGGFGRWYATRKKTE